MRPLNASRPSSEEERARALHAELMMRSLAGLFAIAAALLVLALVLSDHAQASTTIIAAGSSTATAALLFAGRRKLPSWSVLLFLSCGSLLIEWVVLRSGESATTYTVFYFWIAIYAFQYLKVWQAFLQLAFVFLSYSVVLGLLEDPTSPQALRWALTTVALVVAGAMIGVLRHRNSRLIDALAESARVDGLTGLLNRRGFEERFAQELARAKRSGERFSVVIGDLDAFKAVNDGYGHQAGDQALETVGRCLADGKRVSDEVARIGGEEFAAILPDTDEHGAYLFADRLRIRVAEACRQLPGSLTISLGIATFPQHGHEGDSLVRAADQALYMAKRLGRDRAVVYNAATAPTISAAIREGNQHHEDHLATALRLAEVLDLRDSGTASHSQTVGRYAELIARQLGFPTEACERIRYAGIVHDVGKVGIPDSILCKPGSLTPEEETEMRKHPEIGARILAGSNLGDISAWVIAHHERSDGTGYPLGLSAEEIPVEAHILAVADAYEAMTNDRVYRRAMSEDEAQAELIRGLGTQFNEEVVNALLAGLGRDGAKSPLAAA
jgi:diguanylate cyclase (GGDEF)-like protein/putative nucleotidyltransferase with HDIG domain